MSSERAILTPDEHAELELTALVRHRLEVQFESLEQQHEVAALGMWVFLATEVMFFGTLFLGLAVFRMLYADAFEAASVKLNWVIGGINTVVLLVSSLSMVLAVHYAKLGLQRRVLICLALTAFLGICFLCLKGLEYYIDYLDNLIPGWAFDNGEWLKAGLSAEQIPHVKLFLLFYWIMTGFHALHMIIGIAAVSTMFVMTWRGVFTPTYYSPIDVTALYWHFVDLVWIFLLPMLYLQGTHSL
jgi:cytochrome c oxidase subunit 3